jgi:hypothetical protein
MTDTAKEVDHERIYLQPKCCAHEDIGRLWCEHDSPEDCEDGEPWTEYVRADLYAALQSRVEALEKAGQWVPVSTPPSKRGVHTVWIEADSPPKQLHGHGYYDGSDGWKMVQAADEYQSSSPAFEDYGMRVAFYIADYDPLPPAPQEAP